MIHRTARRHRVLLLDYRHADTPAREVGGPYTWAEALHASRQFAVGAAAALPEYPGRTLQVVALTRGAQVVLSAPGSAALVLEFFIAEDES